MKFAFEKEDSVFHLLIGILIIAFNCECLPLPNLPYLWGALFLVSFTFTLFDIHHIFTDLGRHMVIVVLAVLNNVILGSLEIAYALSLFNLDIPKLSTVISPFLSNFGIYIGLFFAITSIAWLIVWPLTE